MLSVVYIYTHIHTERVFTVTHITNETWHTRTVTFQWQELNTKSLTSATTTTTPATTSDEYSTTGYSERVICDVTATTLTFNVMGLIQ